MCIILKPKLVHDMKTFRCTLSDGLQQTVAQVLPSSEVDNETHHCTGNIIPFPMVYHMSIHVSEIYIMVLLKLHSGPCTLRHKRVSSIMAPLWTRLCTRECCYEDIHTQWSSQKVKMTNCLSHTVK